MSSTEPEIDSENKETVPQDSKGVYCLWRNLFALNHPVAAENLARLLDPSSTHFRIRADSDIVICAFAKSGTHWLHNVLHMILAHDVNAAPPDKTVGFLEYYPCHLLEQMISPRILNTHLTVNELRQIPGFFPDINNQSGCKIIQVVRDPRDVVVSFFYHALATRDVHLPFRKDFHDFFRFFMTGTVEGASYFDYIRDWWTYIRQEASTENVLLLYFEDLKTDFPNQLKRILKFLKMEDSILQHPQFFQELVQAAEFSQMQKSQENRQQGAMYRKGTIGDWKNHFDEVELNTLRDRYNAIFPNGDGPYKL